MRRVVIVDDNEITRAGSVRLLESEPGIDVVAAMDHATALDWDREWCGVDVIVVDAADESRDGDQFPGVEVVCHVRTRACDTRPIVIVLTGHFLDDALRRRMWEADADFFYSRTEVASGDALRAVVLDPDQARLVPKVVDPSELLALGIVDSSNINSFVRYVEKHGLSTVLSADARMKQGPHTSRSRWWSQLRRSLSGVGRIRAVNVDGAPPPGTTLPSITQIRRLYQWASKTKTPRP